MLQDRIPTRLNLRKRKILHEDISICCGLCEKEGDESTIHLFYRCKFSALVWKHIGIWLDANIVDNGDIKENLTAFSKLVPNTSKDLWQAIWHGTIWFIWLSRNENFFNGKEVSFLEVVERVKFNVWSWLKAKDGVSTSYNFCDWELYPKGVIDQV